MRYAANTRDEQIAIELGKCATSVKRAGKGHWEFALANGRPLGASARIVEEWLLLDAPLPDRIAGEGWFDLLRLNANLQGFSKFVLMPRSAFCRAANFSGPTNFSLSLQAVSGDGGAGVKERQTEVCRTGQNVHLRADIPLMADEDSDLDYEGELNHGLMIRLNEACLALRAAFHNFHGEKTDKDPATTLNKSLEATRNNRLEELRRLCGDTGWRFTERSGGKLMIDLDVEIGFYQAAAEPRGEGAHISVEIASSEIFGEMGRQALSRLLLETGGLVKLARPSIKQNGSQIAARFEVEFTTMPAAVELTHAFSSLSVACALSGREARAIQDEVIARNYLAVLRAPESLLVSSGATGD